MLVTIALIAMVITAMIVIVFLPTALSFLAIVMLSLVTACGEVLLNREHGDRYSELIGQFQRHVALVRKKFDLDPRQAAEIFGGGVSAFPGMKTGRLSHL